ncbi:ACT domain-containing protein [Alishewanella sp. SMS8]|uniref:ACT domain-containing protein n=1 Tax=Alishewanella sp. SMS8 TaxID=2994676 RepID=UPI002740A348|nr:ACT domain-containing protein [Alishewanella sp. SMS8]MDP5207726.1 ACT domain-containing protein [Alishewanella sp. SMS9]MDP5460436.1 ACT domain-containing protein [Alishewanella sp. SMS8]
MTAVVELKQLLAGLKPQLMADEWVFCTVTQPLAHFLTLDPLATFLEPEGLTLVLKKTTADQAGLAYSSSFKQITLTVLSSLDAVGLTAAVAAKLTEKGISANVMAAYYHDHIFVPTSKATAALAALNELTV